MYLFTALGVKTSPSYNISALLQPKPVILFTLAEIGKFIRQSYNSSLLSITQLYLSWARSVCRVHSLVRTGGESHHQDEL